MTTTKDRARAYIGKMPPAISGQGGDTATYNVALVLAKDFDLEESTAFELLAEWNASQCQPPWSQMDLRHKLQSAMRSPRPPGRLLQTSQAPSHGSTPTGKSAADEKARKRGAWPALVPPVTEQIGTIAALRSLPVEAVDLCSKSGLISTARVDGHGSFVIREGHFAQARRFDGQPFTRHDGTTMKSKNLPGSEGAFIGQKWLGKENPILLVEGAIGLLEAVAATLLADRTDWTCLAATSASSRFARDPSLLARLKGRRVRIVPDSDEAGLDAAAIWLTELEAAGAKVDAVAMPADCKDLGAVVARPERFGEWLSSLFV